MKNEKKVFRHEIKYFINKKQISELRLFLKEYMQIDSHCKEKGFYWIRSLYFDTMDNGAYYEKIIGHNIRKKIRLRSYDTNSSTVKLEIKNKYDNYILKETASISKEDACNLIKGSSFPLLKYNETITNKVFFFMHRNFYNPKVIIDYDREAYIYPFENIRITLDKNLYASFSSYDFFKKDIQMFPMFNNPISILEVKYNNILPISLQKVLSNFEIQRSQISKYCLGRNILKK
ncbi:polyphosphate polymerase domain-containing protein [Dethiothermospora halolimnae]|uniref:polyphosphate polymerase domain-containing protein n=1 Tax=Dethiothermospora halolimnae TaxID=3114390 RepID=UPI003CCC3889